MNNAVMSTSKPCSPFMQAYLSYVVGKKLVAAHYAHLDSALSSFGDWNVLSVKGKPFIPNQGVDCTHNQYSWLLKNNIIPSRYVKHFGFCRFSGSRGFDSVSNKRA